MTKQRLDQAVLARGLAPTRSQAESWIRLGKVKVEGRVITKPGFLVDLEAAVKLEAAEQYVSRAGLKLASVARALDLDFRGKVMLDVGSSTGGFTDYALQHRARKVIAVDVGTDQLHPTLHGDPRIELHEQTDIRDIAPATGLRLPTKRLLTVESLLSEKPERPALSLSEVPDIVVIDVSFISLRAILPHVATLAGKQTIIVPMVKPQFEAVAANLKHKGVIKNDRMRRDILKAFEDWARQYFVILDKADSEVSGAKGNLERFYKLQRL